MFSRRDLLLGFAATGAVATERQLAAVPDTDVPASAPDQLPGAARHLRLPCPRVLRPAPVPALPGPAPTHRHRHRSTSCAEYFARFTWTASSSSPPRCTAAAMTAPSTPFSGSTQGHEVSRSSHHADFQRGTAKVATGRNPWPSTELRNLRYHGSPRPRSTGSDSGLRWLQSRNGTFRSTLACRSWKRSRSTF